MERKHLLRWAVNKCAVAHDAVFCDWLDEGQLAIKKDNVPALADMRMIAKSLLIDEYYEVADEWGYITIILYMNPEVGNIPYKEKIDWVGLALALPAGSLDELPQSILET